MLSKSHIALIEVAVGFLLAFGAFVLASKAGGAGYGALWMLPVGGLLIGFGMVKAAVANHCCLRCNGHLSNDYVCETCREDWHVA